MLVLYFVAGNSEVVVGRNSKWNMLLFKLAVIASLDLKF